MHTNKSIRQTLLSLSTAWLLLGVNVVSAQELAPRAYWPAPAGTNVLFLGYQRNTGDILVDPSLPLTGVESEIDYLMVGYQRFFGLFGRTAALQFSLPYADGSTEGILEDEFRQRTTVGLTDARLRLTVNLLGAPTMDVAGFQALRQDPQPIIGASLLVQAPTGGYDGDRLINLGTNRWAIKPAIGMILPLHPTWLFEAEVGVWLFGDNDDFLGETREQESIVSTEVHLIKRIRASGPSSMPTTIRAARRALATISETICSETPAPGSRSSFQSRCATRFEPHSVPASLPVPAATSRCTR